MTSAARVCVQVVYVSDDVGADSASVPPSVPFLSAPKPPGAPTLTTPQALQLLPTHLVSVYMCACVHVCVAVGAVEDKLSRMAWSMQQALDTWPSLQWVVLANDHAFLLPPNLAAYLAQHYSPSQPHYLGHALEARLTSTRPTTPPSSSSWGPLYGCVLCTVI